jgi:hypothetical protein
MVAVYNIERAVATVEQAKLVVLAVMASAA